MVIACWQNSKRNSKRANPQAVLVSQFPSCVHEDSRVGRGLVRVSEDEDEDDAPDCHHSYDDTIEEYRGDPARFQTHTFFPMETDRSK